MSGKGVVTLPKRIGWPLLVFLVFLDAFVTFGRGQEGNPLWKPFVETFGLNVLWLLAAAVIPVFYAATKLLGRLIERFDRVPQGEEIVLTGLVIAFAAYDIYIIFLLPYFGFLGSRSHYAIIPLLMVPLIAYIVLLEYKRRKHA